MHEDEQININRSPFYQLSDETIRLDAQIEQKFISSSFGRMSVSCAIKKRGPTFSQRPELNIDMPSLAFFNFIPVQVSSCVSAIV